MAATSLTDLDKRQHRTLFAFYATGALREIIPIYPLYSVMFLSHGITPFELSLLFVIWASVGLLLEVPSGALADAFSRKWLVIFAGILKSAAFVCWFTWQDFTGYALGFICWGAGSSLRSGAFEALLFETLKSWQASTRFPFHFGRIRALSTISVLLGEASGGILITFGFDFVLLVSAAVPILVSIPFLLLVDDVGQSDSHHKGSFIKAAWTQTKGSPQLLSILFVSSFLLTVHGIFDEYVPPLFQEHGFSLSMIAYLAIPVFLAQAAGEYLADRAPAFTFKQQVMVTAAGTLCLIPAALFSNWSAVVALSVFFFTFGFAGTLLETQLQETIEGNARATVTSIIGLGDNLGAIIWFLFFGAVADLTSISSATLVLVIATLILCLVTLNLRFMDSD